MSHLAASFSIGEERFWEKQGQLKPERPIRGAIRSYHIGKDCNVGIEGKATDAKYFAKSSAHEYRPLISLALRLPISRNNWGRREVPGIR